MMKRFLALFHFWCQLTANKIDAEGSLYIVLLPQSPPQTYLLCNPPPPSPIYVFIFKLFCISFVSKKKMSPLSDWFLSALLSIVFFVCAYKHLTISQEYISSLNEHHINQKSYSAFILTSVEINRFPLLLLPSPFIPRGVSRILILPLLYKGAYSRSFCPHLHLGAYPIYFVLFGVSRIIWF